MIDLEHCTILGGETVDANSLNRCMFNLHRKMVEASDSSVDATSENVPSSPFFSGGHEDMLGDLNVMWGESMYVSATESQSGAVPRLYRGDLDITGSQDNPSFFTESVTGAYCYGTNQLSTFAPTVDALYGDSPLVLKSVLEDDTTTMVAGVSSLGVASSPTVRFTSYLTCGNSGVSFGTITFSRDNGDRQRNTVTLSISRDLVGMDGIESVDFFSIGNGFASGVRTVSDGLEMVSDISQCTVTYNSDTEVTISDITKSDSSDSITFERDTGRVVPSADGSSGRFATISNDEVVLNFFILFTLKENAVKYSDGLWCFYISDDPGYAREFLSDATGWAKDYFRYSFSGFEVADDGRVLADGTRRPTSDDGCVKDATDAFYGCYNATLENLWWISPALQYADRMFKGCTYATFGSITSDLDFPDMRSAVSMFENCMTARFGNVEHIRMTRAVRLNSMFAGCVEATFDRLVDVDVSGDASKMFYGDSSSDFLSLTAVKGSATRTASMFEGCSNAELGMLRVVRSNPSEQSDPVDSSRMFYGLKKPKFDLLSSIDLAGGAGQMGYDGVSMFDGCLNADFSSLTSVGKVVDGTRMFAALDPNSPLGGDDRKNLAHATFENLHSLGPSLRVGKEMFKDDYYLTMTITAEPASLADGTSMFQNTSTVEVRTSLPSLIDGDYMFDNTCTADVRGDMDSLRSARSMFSHSASAGVYGSMDSLVYADSMFLSSDHVRMLEFPSTVQYAQLAFASVTGYCEISGWQEAVDQRWCGQSFQNSRNISITGDVVGGKIVSTSNMFASASGVRIVNTDMTSPTGAANYANRFYSTEAGENFSYVTRLTDEGEDGDVIFVGDGTPENIGSLIAESLSSDLISSMFIHTNLKARSVEYSIWSLSSAPSFSSEPGQTTPPTATLECSGITFDADSITAYGDYSYGTIYESDGTEYVPEDVVVRRITSWPSSSAATGYVITRTDITSTQYADGRTFVVSAIDGYPYGQGFAFYRYDNIGAVTDPGQNPTYYGRAYYQGSHYEVSIEGGAVTSTADTGFGSIGWDFILTGDSESNPDKALFSVVFDGIDGSVPNRNCYAIDESPLGIVPIYRDGYRNFVCENSKDAIRADVVPVYMNDSEGTAVDNFRGFLMRYSNPGRDGSIKDYRLVYDLTGYGDAENALGRMMSDPKRRTGTLSVAQVFSEESYGGMAPFGAYGNLDSGTTSRVQTNFPVGNAEMGGEWKYANSMFENVFQDSLLSAYFCFTDESLENVRRMFAVDEPSADDTTFRYAGPILQNLQRSNVADMEAMMLNRTVCEPAVFKDLWNDGDADYIAFQLPEHATNAASAFMGLHLSSTSEVLSTDSGDLYEFSEIGLNIPKTLTGVDALLSGYEGPPVRFGYGSDGYVYLADGFSCRDAFMGVEFVVTGGEQFGFSVPSIYMQLFEGSNFEMGSVSSLEARNGMNFASPYSDDVYFFNDGKLLGCGSVSFDALRTDVLDWFCTSGSAVEGVYLATVIGPKNEYSEDGRLTADYRLMTAERSWIDHDGDGHLEDGYWKGPTMSPITNFDVSGGGASVEALFGSTSSLRLSEMTELANPLGRMTCMFSPSAMFRMTEQQTDDADAALGNAIHLSASPSLYLSAYYSLSDEELRSRTYSNMEFGKVRTIDALEMPLAFHGLSGATFGALESIGPSPVVGYGAFMCCSAATFGDIGSVRFMQDSEQGQLGAFSSRFCPSVDMDGWYGNYCSMFAGCSSATFESLSTLMVNSVYGTYGSGDRVLAWYDRDDPSSFDFATYSAFDRIFSFAFRAVTSETDHDSIHLMLADRDARPSIDYDTGCGTDAFSSISIAFSGNPDSPLEIMTRVELSPKSGLADPSDPFLFFMDTRGRATNDPSEDFVSTYSVRVGDELTYTIGASGSGGTADGAHIIMYRDMAGYHAVEVGDDYAIDINDRVKVVPAQREGGTFVGIEVYDNYSEGGTGLKGRYVDTSAPSAEGTSTRYLVEMADVNGKLMVVLTLSDRYGMQHIYEILGDGTVNPLEQHPEFGVVDEVAGYTTSLTSFLTSYEGTSGYINDLKYVTPYGDVYTIDTYADAADFTVRRGGSGTPVQNGSVAIISEDGFSWRNTITDAGSSGCPSGAYALSSFTVSVEQSTSASFDLVYMDVGAKVFRSFGDLYAASSKATIESEGVYSIDTQNGIRDTVVIGPETSSWAYCFENYRQDENTTLSSGWYRAESASVNTQDSGNGETTYTISWVRHEEGDEVSPPFRVDAMHPLAGIPDLDEDGVFVYDAVSSLSYRPNGADCSAYTSNSAGRTCYLSLKGSDGVEVARFGTPEEFRNAEPEDLRFRLGSYVVEANGTPCTIVTVNYAPDNRSVYYRIYKDVYSQEYSEAFTYVEQTEYDPYGGMTYRKLFELNFGGGVAVGHRAHCSGMFMDCGKATFGDLDTVSIPATGSCEGMFSGCSSINLSSLRWLVLPVAADSEEEYSGLFAGVHTSSMTLSGLLPGKTNIGMLGKGASRTSGVLLFEGMLDDEGVIYDRSFHPMTEDIATGTFGLDQRIADQMEWSPDLFKFTVRTSEPSESYSFSAYPFVGDVQVDWGDGQEKETVHAGSEGWMLIGHEYSDAGEHKVMVYGALSAVVMGPGEGILGDEPRYDTQLVSVESFGLHVESLSYAFAGCTALTSAPGWNERVSDVSNCYRGCASLGITMPAWNYTITDCASCYYGCERLKLPPTTDMYELMPVGLDEYSGCVYGCSDSVRRMFPVEWGGTGVGMDATRISVKVKREE